MSASYMTVEMDGGRQEIEIESNSIAYGLLRSGPGGFPPCNESRKWWGPDRWLEWAGTGAEWVCVEEETHD
jgi:hypothetical protein